MPAPNDAPDTWLPRRSPGAEAAPWVGGALTLAGILILALAFLAEPGAGQAPPLLLGSLFLAAGGGILLLAVGYRQLRYELARDGLRVHWLGRLHVLPYGDVDGIYPGQRLVGRSTPRAPFWPGLFVGRGRARGVGRLSFFATSREPAHLTLVTAGAIGAVLSARDPTRFRAELIRHVQATPEGDAASAAPALARLDTLPAACRPWSAVHDRWARASLAAAWLLLLAQCTFLALQMPSLPDRIPLRFEGGGTALEVGARGDLFRLPLGGLFIALLNGAVGVWLHVQERLLARIIWGSAVLVLLITGVAVIRLVQ